MTEFNFTLPHGLIDNDNQIYRQGTMRLATAKDEITVHNDSRFKQNTAYHRNSVTLSPHFALFPEDELAVGKLSFRLFIQLWRKNV